MENIKINKDMGTIHDFLAGTANSLEARLLDACRQDNEPAAQATLAELLKISRVKYASERVMQDMSKENTIPTYLISPLTIQEAYSVLTKTADEALLFMTGLVIENRKYAVTRLLEFELKRQSVIAAEGEQQAVTRLLIWLHNHDHKLLMTWHSHPGSGANSTTPSAIDMDFHRRLEAGNYPVIGGIVNRQGYVRFFSYKRPFKVSIYGKGMEVADEQHNVFKLDTSHAV
ncbi:MAG: Mov34/MPN/PAD-1 family protein [Kiritimatiellae bacterium]|nr:Mov34/MPN/PAD-1 family protein [Kiritimatiellia bacterium]